MLELLHFMKVVVVILLVTISLEIASSPLQAFTKKGSTFNKPKLSTNFADDADG